MGFDSEKTWNECVTHSSDGVRCKNISVIGDPYCWVHLLWEKHLRIKTSRIQGAGKGYFALDKSCPADAIIFRKTRIFSTMTEKLSTNRPWTRGMQNIRHHMQWKLLNREMPMRMGRLNIQRWLASQIVHLKVLEPTADWRRIFIEITTLGDSYTVLHIISPPRNC